MVLGVA